MNPERQRWNKVVREPIWERPSLKEERDWNVESQSYERHLKGLKLSAEDLEKRILDVGSDTGEFARRAAEEGHRNIFSVEIIEPKDRYQIDDSTDYGAGKFVIGDAKQLPFSDNTFDITIS